MVTEKLVDYENIERLRCKVAESVCSLLEREIIDSQVILRAVDAFRISDGTCQKVRCDIPIHSIISLGRKDDTWIGGDTWRDLIMRRLHGTGWPAEVFEYFENEIGDKLFPAPGSRGALEILSYGGVSVCSNGNHRLGAAYCWLAATQGPDAHLKSVNTTIVPIDRKKARMVLKAAQDSHTALSICSVPSPCLASEHPWKLYIQSCSYGKTTYFGLGDDLLKLWPIDKSIPHKIIRLLTDDSYEERRFRECLELQHWHPIPQNVLDIWSTEGWFDDIYARA